MSNTKCLTGFARAGKDTVAKILVEELGMETYALAQPIKDIMCALFNWGEEHRDGSYKEIEMLYSISPATIDAAGIMYNSYGLDKYEAFHDCWDKLVTLFSIEISVNDLAYCVISPRRAFQLFGTEWGRLIDDNIWLDTAPRDNVIITDVRFDNEVEYFSKLGAEVIQVVRPGFRPVNNAHVSEKGVSLPLIDYTINNDKGLVELKETVLQLVTKFK